MRESSTPLSSEKTPLNDNKVKAEILNFSDDDDIIEVSSDEECSATPKALTNSQRIEHVDLGSNVEQINHPSKEKKGNINEYNDLSSKKETIATKQVALQSNIDSKFKEIVDIKKEIVNPDIVEVCIKHKCFVTL